MYLIAFPLLLIPFALYLMVAYLLDMDFSTKLFNVPLLAGRSMSVSTGDLLVLLGIVLLYLEILKATRLASRAIMDHILSFVLFIVMIIVFIAVPTRGQRDVPDAAGPELRRRARRLHHHHPDRAARHRGRPARAHGRRRLTFHLQRNLDDARPRDACGGRIERGRVTGAGAAAKPRLRRALGDRDELGQEGGGGPRMVNARAACGAWPLGRRPAPGCARSMMVNPR